jgi:hypothetical protein
MKTMQDKVKSMAHTLNEIRSAGQEPAKRHHYSLLHDVILFTGDSLDEMSKDSLVGYIELAANALHVDAPTDLGELRMKLIKLGFNTVPPGSLN